MEIQATITQKYFILIKLTKMKCSTKHPIGNAGQKHMLSCTAGGQCKRHNPFGCEFGNTEQNLKCTYFLLSNTEHTTPENKMISI